MAELMIFVLIGSGLIATHFGAVVAYKIQTSNPKSILELMKEL